MKHLHIRGPRNGPPSSMDLALLEAILEKRPYSIFWSIKS
jgi:hypothetical protein